MSSFTKTESDCAGLTVVLRLSVVLALTMAFVFQASAAELRDLIVHNVHIVGPGSQADTDLASIRIKQGVLDLVSTDQIVAEDDTQVLDANEGYLLGNLTVGDAPKFMILNKDPVADLTVLLDTKQYVVFAIDGGQLLANELQPILEVTPDPAMEEKKSRWLSYSPPPTALPTTIDSSRKWNAWKSKYVNGIFISAIALDRQWLSQDDDSIAQFPDLAVDRERGTIRGWRFGVAGTLNFEKPWIYNIAWAWNPFDRGFDSTEEDTNELQFFDFSVDIPAGKNMTVRVGKQKEPINMDRSMTMVQIASQERYAAGDAMFPSRNVGVSLFGTAANQRVSWAAGLFNDWLVEGESLDESATQAVGRVTWLPFVSEDENKLWHLGLGVRYTDAKQGLAYGSRPELGNAPRFVDTEPFDADSSTLYNWEIGYLRGPFWVMAEYSDNHVDAPSVGNPQFTGYHISGTWSLRGEMRPYRRGRGVFGGLPIAQDVYQGGKGALELGLRFSSIDLTEGLIEGGEMDIATAQLNWWLTKSMAVSLNYRRTWTDRLDLEGEMDAFVVRVMLILQ
jgi:phosphate-selective porin OprO/OprP